MWTVEVWLVAVTGPVDPDDVRRHWNSKEAPALDRIMEASPSLRIGTTEPTLPENEGRRGPVGRVVDLLFLRGTTPAYVLPRIDDDLAAEVLAAFVARPEDPPFEATTTEDLKAFLAGHRDAGVTFESRLIEP